MLLLTGATGYLGRVLLELALAEGHAVRVLVRDRARAAVLPGDVEVAVADLADGDPRALADAARGCSGVLHVAGSVGATIEENRRNNVASTAAMLAAAVDAGVPRFVYTSSGAAVMDASGLVSEQPVAPPALDDPYSASKNEAEALVLAASGIEAIVVSPVSIYGPSPAGPLSYNGLFRAAARGEIAEVVDAPMGWVLAEDAAAGHLLALRHGEPGRRYVLCGEVTPVGVMLHRFAAAVGGKRVPTLPPGSTLGPDAPTFARRSEVYGMFPPVHMDDRGARALGFRPRGTVEGIALTAAWCGLD